MNDVIISPSVLSMDYGNSTAQLEALMNSKAEWLHFDVMDGHFVPNISFGPAIMKGMKNKTNLFMDVHLMINDPDYYAPVFIDNGADLITFHYEVYNEIEKCAILCDKIKSLGCKCGVSVKPGTDIKSLAPLLKKLDLVLVMSVEPGFGGQSFQKESLLRISWLKEQREKENYAYKIEVDGGINEETARLVLDAGCDVLVAGSYVFEQDIEKAVESLLCQK